jgi:acyl-CoA thioester hydrolase
VSLPTLQQIRQLRRDLHLEVPPEWEDRNGHVNVQYYLRLYELGGWNIMERAGFDEKWFRDHGVSFFDLDNHLKYVAEIRVGDSVSAHHRVLGRDEKRFFGAYLIVNDSRDRLAAVLEYVTIAVDMRRRRSTQIPAAIAERLDALLEEQGRLGWTFPPSRCIRC